MMVTMLKLTMRFSVPASPWRQSGGEQTIIEASSEFSVYPNQIRQ